MIGRQDVYERVLQSQKLVEKKENLLQDVNIDFISQKGTCTQIENFLNEIIYPKTHTPSSAENAALHDQLMELFGQRAEEKFGIAASEFDFDKHVFNETNVPNDGHILRTETYASFSHSNYIEAQTVLQRVQAAQQKLQEAGIEIMQNNRVSTQGLDPLYTEIATVYNQGNALLEKYELNATNITTQQIPVMEKTKALVDGLDKAYQAASVAMSIPLTPQQIGELWEEVLTIVARGLDGEAITNKLFENLKLQGSEVVSRGGTELLKLQGWEVDSIPSSSSKNSSSVKSYVLTNGAGGKIEIKNVFEDKQSKADVTITMGNVSLRASAKNWSKLSGYKFGDTNLAAALIRSGGLNDTLLYGLGLSWQAKWQPHLNMNLFHKYAKIEVLLDIVGGISQGGINSANVIIINDRTAQQVRVYSIADLITKFAKQTKEAKNVVTGYNGRAIHQSLMRTIDWGNNYVDHDNYEQTIINILQNIKVSVSSNLLSSVEN